LRILPLDLDCRSFDLCNLPQRNLDALFNREGADSRQPLNVWERRRSNAPVAFSSEEDLRFAENQQRDSEVAPRFALQMARCDF